MSRLDLSDREWVVIEQASRGLTIEQAARESCHSPKTVQRQISDAKRKLGTSTIAGAVGEAFRRGLLVAPQKSARA